MKPHAPDSQADHPAIPAGLRSLWAEACEWAAWLANMFSLDKLRAGIRRETGARLTIWLMNIEGAVRRLILAAALALAPPARRAPRACAAARTQPQAATRRRPAFRIFRLHGAGETTSVAPASTPQHKPYGHIPFAADPLLSLGAARITRHANAPRQPTRTRNPLDRWVRPSRQDPDWRPSEDDTLMFGAPAAQRASSPHTPRPPRTPHDPAAIPESLPESLYDWRRRYDEWERAIPAPDLAARLEALVHIAANPAAAIARAARRLSALNTPIHPLARKAATLPAPPRRAAQFPTAGHTADFFQRTRTALDTS